jgi:peptidyl-prolyl cis-trans isomerase A (cyclophilin A)
LTRARIAYVVVAFAFFACKSEEKVAQRAAPAPAAPKTRKLPSEGLVAGAPGAPGSGIPVSEPPRSGDLVATIDTSLGSFQIRLFADKAPRTVENFVGLAEGSKAWKDPRTGQFVKRPFFEGLTFHKVIPEFAVQTGDPSGDGSGDPGYLFEDEFHPSLQHDRPGIVTMANRGRNTNGSQFLITLRPLPILDGRHSIFGEVISGMEVVEAIAKVPTDAKSRPLNAIIIRRVNIKRAV